MKNLVKTDKFDVKNDIDAVVIKNLVANVDNVIYDYNRVTLRNIVETSGINVKYISNKLAIDADIIDAVLDTPLSDIVKTNDGDGIFTEKLAYSVADILLGYDVISADLRNVIRDRLADIDDIDVNGVIIGITTDLSALSFNEFISYSVRDTVSDIVNKYVKYDGTADDLSSDIVGTYDGYLYDIGIIVASLNKNYTVNDNDKNDTVIIYPVRETVISALNAVFNTDIIAVSESLYIADNDLDYTAINDKYGIYKRAKIYDNNANRADKSLVIAAYNRAVSYYTAIVSANANRIIRIADETAIIRKNKYGNAKKLSDLSPLYRKLVSNNRAIDAKKFGYYIDALTVIANVLDNADDSDLVYTAYRVEFIDAVSKYGIYDAETLYGYIGGYDTANDK